MSTNNQLRQEPVARSQGLQTGALSPDTISYAAIRKHFARDHDLFGKLERGRKVLQTNEELAQYMYSYAPMTERQWGAIYGEVTLPSVDFAVIDYAAGQGLATIHLLDRLGENRKLLNRCTLTDTSGPCLQRALEVLSIYNDTLEINCFEKHLDAIEIADLYAGEGDCFVHLFSNIIDVDTFDLPSLLSKVLDKNGFHQLIAVSPSRNFQGGDTRLHEMSDWLIEANKLEEIKLLDAVRYETFQDQRWKRHSLCVARCEVTNGSL